MRIGILIVGSLYWDGSDIRCRWRRDRLGCSDKRTVRVPIRYGRRSAKRGNTFTMVFARSCASDESLGTALVVPARAECCEPSHLIEEAECLWAAERNSPNRAGIAATWGRVALLQPSGRPIREDYLRVWADAVSKAGSDYRQVPSAVGEDSLIDLVSGLAQFKWPVDADTREALSNFDALLMTATEPSLTESKHYPSARDIAEAWRADSRGHVAYFYNNIQNGITTFEDDEILRVLRGEPPNIAMEPAAQPKA